VSNFDKYDLIIDARCPREFEEDHIPGAFNFPVANNEEYAEVGTIHRTDKMRAYSVGVEYSLKNIARHLREDIAKYSYDTRILVYCFRGGKRSKLWCDALETIGYNVERLKGGWKAYRRWVNEQLSDIPPKFNYNVLIGSTGCGKTRLLHALREVGAQVLDLEEIAVHRGSVLGAIPGKNQPSQKLFDSHLNHQLSSFDPSFPVWVEAESKKVGNVQLPIKLLETMRSGLTIQIEAPMPQRVLLWREDYHHFEERPLDMLKQLAFLRQMVGGEEFSIWETLAKEKKMPELFERLMKVHYDPAYRRSTLRNYPEINKSPTISLCDLSHASLLPIAESMRFRFEKK
jgi:tRNA 2-selenouridine synthase